MSDPKEKGNVAELADAVDSKSTDRKILRVQVSPFPPTIKNNFTVILT